VIWWGVQGLFLGWWLGKSQSDSNIHTPLNHSKSGTPDALMIEIF
jgi:hypothetical protein